MAQDELLEKILNKLEGMDTRLESVDTRLNKVDSRLDGIDTRLVGVEKNVQAHREETKMGFQEVKEAINQTYEDQADLLREILEVVSDKHGDLEKRVEHLEETKLPH